MRGAPTTGRLLGALRYGPSSSTGPDTAAPFLEMTPAELAAIKCLDFYKAHEIILAARSSFTQAQLDALIQRSQECTGSVDPGLLAQVIVDKPGEIAEDAIKGALGAEGFLGGLADVIGNTVLAIAGVGLVVLGVARVFGVTPKSALGR